MPNAFRSVGYIAGIMMMLTIGAVSVYCMLLLVTAKHKARESFNVKSYGDLSWIAGGNAGQGSCPNPDVSLLKNFNPLSSAACAATEAGPGVRSPRRVPSKHRRTPVSAEV